MTVICDTCGDHSNSEPNLRCGRVDDPDEDGRVPVSEAVSTILYTLAGQANEALQQAREGDGDYLASIEELSALLTLLAGGTWGAGTRPVLTEPCQGTYQIPAAYTVVGIDEDDTFAIAGVFEGHIAAQDEQASIGEPARFADHVLATSPEQAEEFTKTQRRRA